MLPVCCKFFNSSKASSNRLTENLASADLLYSSQLIVSIVRLLLLIYPWCHCKAFPSKFTTAYLNFMFSGV
ncbi:hypothetical protein HanIR_Chr15g0751951 [Helianthus annuus]|nr:hypothetical protein HanIR_Chr15g0751951 [Helianthus annuus]